MGRLTTTTENKQKNGTNRTRPKKTVKGLQITRVPKPPKEWDDDMKKIFKDCCKDLIDRDMLFEGDINLLVMYSKETAIYFDLWKKVGTDYLVAGSMGQEVVNPLIKIANQSLQNAIKIGKEFGFSPYSKRLVGEGIPEDEEKNDPFQKLLKS